MVAPRYQFENAELFGAATRSAQMLGGAAKQVALNRLCYRKPQKRGFCASVGVHCLIQLRRRRQSHQFRLLRAMLRIQANIRRRTTNSGLA